jgi:hypothetical protein
MKNTINKSGFKETLQIILTLKFTGELSDHRIIKPNYFSERGKNEPNPKRHNEDALHEHRGHQGDKFRRKKYA